MSSSSVTGMCGTVKIMEMSWLEIATRLATEAVGKLAEHCIGDSEIL